MIVLDASAAVDLLVEPAHTGALRARLREASIVYAPHLMDAEVTDALRRKVRQGRIDQLTARRAIRRLGAMRLKLRPHRPLLGRAFALRDQLSAYHAIYAAMAEATGATLLTRDMKLARTTGHRAEVEVV